MKYLPLFLLASCASMPTMTQSDVDARIDLARTELRHEFKDADTDVDQAVDNALDAVRDDLELQSREFEQKLTEAIPGILTDPIGGGLAALFTLLTPVAVTNGMRNRKYKVVKKENE